MNQLELFSDSEQNFEPIQHRQASFFAKYILPHEKFIFIVIALFVTAIISFCIGVEKGKNISLSKTPMPLQVSQTQALSESLSEPEATEPLRVKAEPKTELTQETEPKGQSNRFTIQVASFSIRAHAEAEAEKLKKQGMIVLVMPKGKHIVVCVGSFVSRQAAESLLPTLRNKYADCFIRRL